MTVVDLHPEDLLDKDARGELSDAESERLDAHLARCSACRAEQTLRMDFLAELDGDDRPSAILGLVAGALKSADADALAARTKGEAEAHAAALAAAAKLASETPTVETHVAETESEKVVVIPGLVRPRRAAFVMLFAAAFVLAASVAGATGMGARVWKGLRGDGAEVTHLESTPTSHAVDPPPAPTQVAIARAAVVETPDEQEPAPPTNSARLELPVRPVSFNTPPSPSAAEANAAALFDAANAARRSGDVATALSLYDGLAQKYPASREARASKATTARLLLDRGDASGAARRFDAYLASGAPELREEAMAGRATALERLGRDEDESSAWALLLATYPRTPYAAHARARIARSVPR